MSSLLIPPLVFPLSAPAPRGNACPHIPSAAEYRWPRGKASNCYAAECKANKTNRLGGLSGHSNNGRLAQLFSPRSVPTFLRIWPAEISGRRSLVVCLFFRFIWNNTAVSGQEPLPSRCWWKQNNQRNSRRGGISSENARSASILLTAGCLTNHMLLATGC